jgi:hypothetical protein
MKYVNDIKWILWYFGVYFTQRPIFFAYVEKCKGYFAVPPFVYLHISQSSLTSVYISSKLNKCRAYSLQASYKGFENLTGFRLRYCINSDVYLFVDLWLHFCTMCTCALIIIHCTCSNLTVYSLDNYKSGTPSSLSQREF